MKNAFCQDKRRTWRCACITTNSIHRPNTQEDSSMKFAVLGCGYVSDSYAKTLDLHKNVEISGVFDVISDRAEALAKLCGCKAYKSFDDLLNDGAVETVINLTNPREHFTTSAACLKAGKNIYSEKPIGMNLGEAKALLALAKENDLLLATAPCSVLSPAAQTMWKAIRDGVIGKVRLVYANFEDGMIAPQMEPWTWLNSVGVPWPAKDEFEVGCTYEHAGYFLSWLATFFGPAHRVTSFASCQIPDKGIAVDEMAPDFTCGCIEFGNGVVARASCGLVAPRDKSLTVSGDEGTLKIENQRDDFGSVLHTPYRPTKNVARARNFLAKVKRIASPIISDNILRKLQIQDTRRLPLIVPITKVSGSEMKRADFLRGPAEMASAVREKRPCRLPGELGVHMVEILEGLQYPEPGGKQLTTTIPDLQPLISTT
jgi:predicted dehydrogenase